MGTTAAATRSHTAGRIVLALFVGTILATAVAWWVEQRSTPVLPSAARGAPPPAAAQFATPIVPAQAPIQVLGPEATPEPEFDDAGLVLGPSAPASRTVAVDPAGVAFGAADPAIVRDGDMWRVFTTHEVWVNVPSWESADGVTWTSTGEALPLLPDWATWGFTWAPDVVRTDDGWVLFFSARFADTERQCIGHAVAQAATGPFEPFDEPIVCELDEGGSIDPSVFRDADGELHLLWKVDANARGVGAPSVLRSQRLDASATRLVGSPSELLRYELADEWPLIEQPEMVLVDGVHHLLYAAGWYNQPTYHVRHAVCDGPAGPCVRDGAGPWLATEVGIEGPGALSLELFGDEFVGVYHAWLDGFGEGRFRSMVIDRFEFVDGRPGVVDS